MSNQTQQFNAAEVNPTCAEYGHMADRCNEFNQQCTECGEIIPDAEFAAFWAEEFQARKEYRRALNLAFDPEYYADEEEE